MQIALTAKMRSGKDELADYAVRKYGFTKYGFGDGIRIVCRDLFPDKMKNGNKQRSLLQGVGQSMRQFDNDVWVNWCFKDIQTEMNERNKCGLSPLLPVVKDLRQPNEYKRCKEEGFTIIKIHTDDDIRLVRMNEKGDKFTLEDLQHETEMYIDGFEVDYTIYNNSSLEAMFEQFDKIMEELKNVDSH